MPDETKDAEKPQAPPAPKITVTIIDEGENQLGLRTRVLTVHSENPRYRDNKLVFVITEKPAMQAELWAVKVLKVLVSSGVDIGGDPLAMGMRGLAVRGITALGGLPMDLVEELLREMMACVQIIPDYQRLPKTYRPLTENDIREIPTLFHLKQQVFDLHTDFLQPVVPSISSQGVSHGLTGHGSRAIRTSQGR